MQTIVDRVIWLDFVSAMIKMVLVNVIGKHTTTL